MRPWSVSLVVVFCSVMGCDSNQKVLDDASPADAGVTDLPDYPDCPSGLKPRGPACVPVFSECKKGELALPGGGCKRVGAEEVGGGIRVWPGGKTTAIGPTCKKGFKKRSKGGCEPVLPPAATKCPAGTMQVLGYTTCQPIGDCGQGDYGNIVTTKDTVFVNAGYTGSASDGSKSKPYKTLTVALKAAAGKSGTAHVAVAAGSFEEDLALSSPVTLDGRCAKLVQIKGKSTTADAAALTLKSGADGTTLRGLAITGPVYGVLVLGAKKISIKQVAVTDTGDSGIHMDAASGVLPGVTIKDSLLARCTLGGVFTRGGTLIVNGVESRETRFSKKGYAFGVGIASTNPTQVTIRDSVVQDNIWYGICCYANTLTVERTVVRNNKFHGIENSKTTSMAVRDSYLRGNGGISIKAISSALTVDGCTVLGGDQMAPAAVAKYYTFGLGAAMSTFSVQDSHFAFNWFKGLFFEGSKGTVRRSVITDTRASIHTKLGGEGIQVEPSSAGVSDVVIQDCLVANNRTFGVSVLNSTAKVERSVVRGTQPSAAGGAGTGVLAYTNKQGAIAKVTVLDSLVADNSRIGIDVRGADGTIQRVHVRGTGDAAGKYGASAGILATAYDAYQNTPSKVSIVESLIADNYVDGIDAISGATVVVNRSTVRSSRSNKKYPGWATGILVRATPLLPSQGLPLDVTLRDSLFEDHEAFGVLVLGEGKVMVDRTLIRNTRYAKEMYGGYGVFAGSDKKFPGKGPKLDMTNSEIRNSYASGVSLNDTLATMTGCAVTNTSGAPGSGSFGDGVAFVQLRRTVSLDMSRCFLDQSARAGLVFWKGKGQVRGSAFQYGTFSIVLEEGASPSIAGDNIYRHNKRNAVAFGQNLKPAPIPNMTNIPDPFSTK